MVNEIFLMRSVACLGIVILHSVDRVFPEGSSVIISLVKLLLVCSTPIFIFISEFILAKTYREELPSTFWGKRIKYVLLPFLFFGTFYALAKAIQESLGSEGHVVTLFLTFLWKHLILGDYHGYFILVIFQFYLLHYFFHKLLKKANPVLMIGLSLLTTLAYLGFFNFTNPLPTPIWEYIWETFYWIPFPGWLFYFTLAYYCGVYYEEFITSLKKSAKWILITPILFAIISLTIDRLGWIEVISSKRVDMVFYSTSLILLLYYAANQMKNIPRFFIVISQYSFGIYLFHPFYLAVMYMVFSIISYTFSPAVEFLLYVTGSTLLSMISTYVLNKLPFGKYVSGRIGIGMKKEKLLFDPKQNYVQARAK
ncbi:acyltransferase family protein [Bacillus sp. 2205SS5-2]|uniref:acyltransferase family protein n=1 Tax=Bacillus sp. 2205SS5-2 TaxID=3109031 RepID=UPI003003F46E